MFEKDSGIPHELQSSTICFTEKSAADCYTEMSFLEYDIEIMTIRKVLLSKAKT